jgi:hypothetical protein
MVVESNYATAEMADMPFMYVLTNGSTKETFHLDQKWFWSHRILERVISSRICSDLNWT